MQRYLGKKNFPFIKLSSRIISDYQGKLLASIEAYEEIVAYARKKQAETGSKLLWGTANVFGHARYMNEQLPIPISMSWHGLLSK